MSLNIKINPNIKSTAGLNQNRNAQQIQRPNNHLVSSPQRDTVSFTGAKQTKAAKKFIELIYNDILKELGIKNSPKLSIKTMSLGAGGFNPCKGEVSFSEKILNKKAVTLGNVVRHELLHFEQFSLIARLPNGISRLEKTILAMEEQYKPLEEALKKRSIYDDFLFRDTKKKAELNKQLNEVFDKEKFRAFYEKIVEEKGTLEAGSLDAHIAEGYLQAYSEYTATGEILKSFKDYDSTWSGIKKKAKAFAKYMLNPLEVEAYKTGATFAKGNKAQLQQVRKACKNDSYNPEKIGLKLDPLNPYNP